MPQRRSTVLFAKVVLGLPVEGPFDYRVPPEYVVSLRAGERVWVNFRNKKELGYVVALAPASRIKQIKPLLSVIDKSPVLDSCMLELTSRISAYYCCSWGEAIEAALPGPLRKGKPVSVDLPLREPGRCAPGNTVVVYDRDGEARWGHYLKAIRDSLAGSKSVIVIVPDKTAMENAYQWLQGKLDVPVRSLSRGQLKEADQWQEIAQARQQCVIGTRSAVFAPVADLGLIILDEESNPAYKQDQVPHYHCREAALMRGMLENATVMLGCRAPSSEVAALVQRGPIQPVVLKRTTPFPDIKIVDMKDLPVLDRKSRMIMSRYLQDAIVEALAKNGRILLMLNRRGFATLASCAQCSAVLRCPRCNVNLVYHFHDQRLRCHYCDFSMVVPKICPSCNAGYIKFSGAGTEKVESEIARLFPQASLRLLDVGTAEADGADILIATQRIVGSMRKKFSLVAVLSIDNSLHHADFRSSEKAFGLLWELAMLTDERMIVQTSLPGHYCFEALKNNDPGIFFSRELAGRKQLKFPPFEHFVCVRCRGLNEEKVRSAAEKLFDIFSEVKKRGVAVVSVAPGQQPKLRGNYYWEVLLRGKDPAAVGAFARLRLKKFKQSGIIITVDVDPV